MTEIKEHEFFGVYTDGDNIFTKSLHKRESVYGERIVRLPGGVCYRQWDPFRSKLGAAILKGLKTWPFKSDSKVLYLGAASGTTVSHVSDICTEGYIFAVEISTRPFVELLRLAGKRPNIFPILADARKYEEYRHIVPKVDIVYQDISQPDQAEIFCNNMDFYLKKGGIGMIMVKARSIDVTEQPSKIFSKVEEYIKERGYEIIERVRLEPFEKDHAAIVVRRVRKGYERIR